MPLEMVRESMALNNKIGEETTQVLVEGDIIVPDTKPDIRNVLKVTGKVTIDEQKPMENRVGFKGNLKVNILYTGRNAERLVYGMQSNLMFEDVVNMDGVTKDSIVTVEGYLEHIEYTVINDRKIGIRAVIGIHILAHDEKKISVVTDIYDTDNVQTKQKTIKMNNVVQRKKDRFAVKEDVSLPSGKPDIFQILQTDMYICNKEIKVMTDKLGVRGIIKVSVIYTAEAEDSLVDVFEKEVPFNGYVEMNGIDSNMIADVDMKILEESVQIVPNDDGEARGMDVEASVGIDAVVTDNHEVEVVDDVYAIDKNTEIEREEVVLPQFIGKNNTKSGIKETITIDGKYPEALQVEKVWGTVRIDNIEVNQDVVTVDGVIDLEVMYIAKDDENPVSVVPVSVPFTQEIEVQGLENDVAVEVAAAIDDISFNMLSDREVEVRTTLDFEVFVVQDDHEYIIKQVEFNDDNTESFKDIGSMVIYVVQPGDSLWSIAKKYNTTIDEILSVNDIENPDNINPGQKLLILKK